MLALLFDRLRWGRRRRVHVLDHRQPEHLRDDVHLPRPRVDDVDSAVGPTTTVAGGGLSAASTVILRGIGPVRVGMTLAEASAAAGKPIVAKPAPSPECGHADPEGGPEGVSFMVVSDHIARVDVASGPVKTLSGAGIGDTEAQVQAKYGNKLEVSPHKYVPEGHYLTLVPTDPADAGFRLIFETDGTKVTRFRAGKQPEASYVEGCS